MIKIEIPEVILKSGEKIPRLIHYCWFGGKPLPRLAKKCIKSWKKYLPDYKIIRWDEATFDANTHAYTREAYEAKKWAFITDYARLYVLYNYGGIYMDSDVEIIRPLDRFLEHSAFSSFESPVQIPTGLLASSKENKWIKSLIDYYENRHFLDKEGNPRLIPNTKIITDISQKLYNLQLNNSYQILEHDVHIYPSEFFCPMNWQQFRIEKTNNTYAVHHFLGSWIEGKEKEKYIKIRKKAGRLIEKVIGNKIYNFIANYLWRKYLTLK